MSTLPNLVDMEKKTKEITKKTFKTVFLYLFLTFYAVISLYPLFFALMSSFKKDFDIFFKPFSLPQQINFDNYIRAWNTSHMANYFTNSVILAVASCIILIFVGSMAAYAITKFHFGWKNLIYVYFLMGLMIPAQSTILPLAFDIGKLGIYDSMTAVIFILTAFQIPISILIFTGFIGGIPDELEEAAIVDGCNVFYVYTRVILPLSVPAIVTVTILNFLAAWNNILFPLVFLNRDTLNLLR